MKNRNLLSAVVFGVSCVMLSVSNQILYAQPAKRGDGLPLAVHHSNEHDWHKFKPEQIAVPRPYLDLSLPNLPLQFTVSIPQQDLLLQKADKGLFANPDRKPQDPLQIKGGWIMSQEPEPEKRKSVDGASISINLKQ